MNNKAVQVKEKQDNLKDLKVSKIEARWRELYLEGKRGIAILDILCEEFFYKNRNSLYRILDVSKLRIEMRS